MYYVNVSFALGSRPAGMHFCVFFGGLISVVVLVCKGEVIDGLLQGKAERLDS